MSSIKNKVSKKSMERQQKAYNYLVAIICIIAGIVPLILYYKEVVLNDQGNLFADGRNAHLDIFSYYKMVFLLLFSAIGLLVFLFIKRDELFYRFKKKYYVLMGVYVLLVILSALLSGYKQVAFFGYLDRFEGAFVLLSYVVIMLLAMNIFNKEKQIVTFFYCLIASAIIVSFIGVLQYLGINYYNSHLLMSLLTPNSLKNSIGELKVNFPSNTIFCTLGNSNYVGSYFAMLLPVLLTFFIYVRKLSYKLILAVPLCMAVLNWIGCGSRAGLVGGGISIILVLVMFRKKIFTHKVINFSAVFLLCISIFVINYFTGGNIFNKIEHMMSFEKKDTAIEAIASFDKKFEGLEDIKMDNTKASIITDKGTMFIGIINGQLSVKDQNNKEIEISQNNDTTTIIDDRFKNIKLNTKRDAGLIEVYYNDTRLINVILTDNGLRSDTNIWLISRGNKEIESFGLKGMESLGSNRGYIWDRTLPLLKNTIILGHGPDTFPLYFPQYDFIGKLRMYQTAGIFVDKPHNFYLQIAVNTGIVSLLVLLAVFGIYFITSIKIYFKQKVNNFLSIAGIACFTAFCGYAVAGMFNDSVVAVAPIFWILLGLGIGINIKMYELKPETKGK